MGGNGRVFTKEEIEKGAMRSRERGMECREQYENSPKHCAHCSSALPYEKRTGKYCNHSCAAKENNKGIRRHGTAPAEQCGMCPNCGVEKSNRNSIHCGVQCAAKAKKMARYLRYEKMGQIDGGARARRMYLVDTRGHKCENCGIDEWLGQPVPVVCDHINGNPEDHRVDNLRLLCQNCNAQTPTFAGRNPKGSGRYYRRKRYQEGLAW